MSQQNQDPLSVEEEFQSAEEDHLDDERSEEMEKEEQQQQPQKESEEPALTDSTADHLAPGNEDQSEEPALGDSTAEEKGTSLPPSDANVTQRLDYLALSEATDDAALSEGSSNIRQRTSSRKGGRQYRRSPQGRSHGKHSRRRPVHDDQDDSGGFRSLPYIRNENADESWPSYPYDQTSLSPRELVDILIRCPDFCAGLLSVADALDLSPRVVKNVISKNPEVFVIESDSVILHPKIGICSDHLSENGCQSRSDCTDVHICPRYIMKHCQNENCVLGHKFKTNHNYRNLQRFHLDDLTKSSLKRIFRTSCDFFETQRVIDVCKDYNESNCDNRYCLSLHICRDYIAGQLVCQRQCCPLNHNILSEENRLLLGRYGIDTNETPRDILADLFDMNPSLGETMTTSADSDQLGIDTIFRQDSIQGYQSTESSPRTVVVDGGHLTQSTVPINTNMESVPNVGNNESSTVVQTHSSTTNMEEDQSANSINNTSNIDGMPTDANSSRTVSTNTNSSVTNANPSITSVSNAELTGASVINAGPPRTSSVQSSNDTSNAGSAQSTDGTTACPASGVGNTNDSDSVVTTNVASRPPRVDEFGPVVRMPSLWSKDLEGDVRVAEICYDSVINAPCPRENFGCPRLHSKEHFHWQISEENASWLNLRDFQVKHLERAFCNPCNDTISLPPLDPDVASTSMSILFLLMGEDVWTANFQGMILLNSDETRILYLRRLCTEIIPGITVEPSIYHWFFCKSDGEWVEYGEDIENEENGYVNSEAIECQFMVNPGSYAQFTIDNCEYILDFGTMTQTNLSTQEVCDVRRRPKPHLPNDDDDDDEYGYSYNATLSSSTDNESSS